MKNSQLITIPNLLTLSNLCAGFLALTQSDLKNAIFCLFLAVIFDVCDGFAARILGHSNEMGKQLDSLADLVSFGIVPAWLYYQVVAFDTMVLLGLFVFISTSALRLAKFNFAEDSKSFQGLPTPAAALFIIGLIIADLYDIIQIQHLLQNSILATLIPISLGILMMVNIKMFSLKTLKEGWRQNLGLIICVIVFIAVFIVKRELVILVTMMTYLAISLFLNIKNTIRSNGDHYY